MRLLIVPIFLRQPALDRLKKTFGSHPDVGEVLDAPSEQAVKVIGQSDFDLIVVCVGNGPPDRELDVIQNLRGATKRPIFAVGPAVDAKSILRTIQAGVDTFLDQAELEFELRTALARIHVNQDTKGPQGRLLAVLSASGGCGGSTVAVNIAAILAKEHGSCNLIDLNPGHGDLASLLDLRPQYTLTEVCQNDSRIDQAMFEKMLARHTNGISLLAAPFEFDEARVLTRRGVCQALAMSRKMFPQVVVDLADCYHEEQVAVFEQASGILLVSRLDFTSLRNARRVLDYVSKLGVPRRRTKVVISHHGQPNELPIEEAEDALGERLTRFVPYDPKTINSANNTGTPAVIKCPNTKLYQAISELSKTDFEHPSGISGFLPKLTNLWKAIG